MHQVDKDLLSLCEKRKQQKSYMFHKVINNMTVMDMAKDLLEVCTFKHKNGSIYLDDALDTWSYLFAEFSPYEWEEVEREVESLIGPITLENIGKRYNIGR